MYQHEMQSLESFLHRVASYLVAEYPRTARKISRLRSKRRVKEIKEVLFVWYAGGHTPQDCSGMIARLTDSYSR